MNITFVQYDNQYLYRHYRSTSTCQYIFIEDWYILFNLYICVDSAKKLLGKKKDYCGKSHAYTWSLIFKLTDSSSGGDFLLSGPLVAIFFYCTHEGRDVRFHKPKAKPKIPPTMSFFLNIEE